MIHTPEHHHDMYAGHWITCECGWSGPARPTKTLATAAHLHHVRSTR